MMGNEDFSHFTCIVVGENPEKLISEYDKNLNVKRKIVAKFADAELLKMRYINICNKLLANEDLNEIERLNIESNLTAAKEDNNVEFFYRITKEYEHDKVTGDAYTLENGDGKYSSCNIGKNLSLPLTLKNGDEVFQARKEEVDWDKMHLFNQRLYEVTWELIIDGRKPEDEQEKTIQKNMMTMENYLRKFETKENYVIHSTAFWGYAFLSEKTGWVELDINTNQFEWVSCFFEKFIVPLQEKELITVYECRK